MSFNLWLNNQKNRVPCAWFRLPSAGVLVLMRLALRPRASCGDRRLSVVTPQTRDVFGLCPHYRFWLVAASTLFCCVFSAYINKVFWISPGVWKFRKKYEPQLAWPNRSGRRSYEAKVLSSSLSASIFSNIIGMYALWVYHTTVWRIWPLCPSCSWT